MLTLAVFALSLLWAGSATAEGPSLSAADVLTRSIAYHDPEQSWSKRALEFTIEVGLSERLAEARGYATRTDRVLVDLPRQRFRYTSQRGEHRYEIACEGEMYTAKLDGSAEMSDEAREKHRLTAERLPGYRDYFTYLLGLPMKLRDPGTRLDPEVRRETFEGRDVLMLRVTYDPDVGGDTWFFYFDPGTYALVGCRFHHDVSKQDGEYLVFEEEVAGPMGLRLPKRRRWYVNQGGEYLAVDDVRSITVPSGN